MNEERLGTNAMRKGAALPMARGLGWFSIALGLPLTIMPRLSGRIIGVGDGNVAAVLTRFAGLRELAVGIGILARPRPVGLLWSRVAGDAIDLGLLTAGMTADDADRSRIATSMALVGGITAADVRNAGLLGRQSEESARPHIVNSITVNAPRDEVYGYWRDFGRLPEFMTHLERVEVDGTRSHWVAKAPAGRSVSWDAEIVDDRAGETIAWRSIGGTVKNDGRVYFNDAPGGRGTEVTVELEYEPPAGSLGRVVAMLFGEEPRQQIQDDLRRFKQVVETGQVVRSDGSPEGVQTIRLLRQRPAQPESDGRGRIAA